jgi:hypothetical protein
MRKILPLLLLAACASKGSSPQPTVEHPGEVVGEAELGVQRTVRSDSALLLELEPKGKLPPRLEGEIGAGDHWLRVDRPRGFSFAGKGLLAGDLPFRPATASFLFVQPHEGPATLADPALLRLRGRIEAQAFAGRVEPVAPPETEGEGLNEVESADLRVLLGHGIDVLLVAYAGSTTLDSHHWIGVVREDGAAADLNAVLDAARKGEALSELAPYRVLVRRRRAGESKPDHFRLRLEDVVVAAQARLLSASDGTEWVWEGVWSARVTSGTFEGPPAWPATAPPLEVRYKEYERPASGNIAGAFWHALLAPVALGTDVGVAFLEGDRDRIAERQRARN